MRGIRIRRGQTRRAKHGNTLFMAKRIELAVAADLQQGLLHPPPRPRRSLSPVSSSEYSWGSDSEVSDDAREVGNHACLEDRGDGIPPECLEDF